MISPEDQINRPPDELLWLDLEKNESFMKKLKSKGIYGVLVPLGCLTTAGVLLRGVYHLVHKNSKKQLAFMKYRVLSQGITLCIVTMGISAARSST